MKNATSSGDKNQIVQESHSERHHGHHFEWVSGRVGFNVPLDTSFRRRVFSLQPIAQVLGTKTRKQNTAYTLSTKGKQKKLP